MIDTKALYWAAGFLEGEGCFRVQIINKPKPGRHMVDFQVVAVQKQREPLERLQASFGGSIFKDSKRDISSWRTHGVRARGIMMTLYSLMSPRRKEQIISALQNSWWPHRLSKESSENCAGYKEYIMVKKLGPQGS